MKLKFKNYMVDDNVAVNYYLKAVVMVEKLEGMYVYYVFTIPWLPCLHTVA